MWHSNQPPLKSNRQKSTKIVVQSPQATNCSLKQIFNITYTHYCSTSVHKKLHNDKNMHCRTVSNYVDFKTLKGRSLRTRKKELSSANPFKLGVVYLQILQKRKNKCDIYLGRGREITKQEAQNKKKNQFLKTQHEKQQNFPLKALGHRINLKVRQSIQKLSKSTKSPRTGKILERQSYENPAGSRLRLKTLREERQVFWNEPSTMEKGWQYYQ